MASRTRAAGLLAAGALALIGAAGCGGDNDSSGSTDVSGGGAATATGGQVLPPTTATPAPAPAATATAPAATATAPATTTGPEAQPGGAGDEQAPVTPAVFTFAAAGVTPARIEVQAFFSVRVSGRSQDGQAHTIVFQGKTIAVPAGRRGSATFTGLKPGRYPVEIDGAAGAATIVAVKDAAGP